MSRVQVNHIKTALKNLYDGKIDMQDYNKMKEEEKEKAFNTRALAAYSIHILASASLEESADAIIDGYDDNGIDAIYYDEQQCLLYIVQSKLIEAGKGEPETGDLRKFKDGIIDLIEEKFDRFNNKFKKKLTIIKEALYNSQIKLNIVLAYTGKGLTNHNSTIINDLVDNLNESTEWTYFSDFNLKTAHDTLNTVLAGKPINAEISLSNWGSIDEPYAAYYGQISAYDLAILWKNNRKKLFAENIRNFIGLSDINSGILKTIEEEPENFIYFNNGVTILCSDVIPLPAKTVGKTTGLFDCRSLSIINGAQTVGSLGIALDKMPNQLKKCKVFVRLIPLSKCPEEFGKQITIASNTQNKIEKRDFVCLDPLQMNLKTELLLQGINYHFKRTDEVIQYDEKNCTLEEATIALACYQDEITYCVTAKREVGRLWDMDKEPYSVIFNKELKSHTLWRAILIYRNVTKYLNDEKVGKFGRESSTYTYGNYFMLNIVFALIEKEKMLKPAYNFTEFINNELLHIIKSATEKTYEIAESLYPTSLIHQLYRNYSKCKELRANVLRELKAI